MVKTTEKVVIDLSFSFDEKGPGLKEISTKVYLTIVYKSRLIPIPPGLNPTSFQQVPQY